MKYTGARILIESLIEEGVDTVFGYPGSAVLHIYDELYRQRDRIRHILVSHEQHAAHAADGYARSTGRPGVCIATSGPGATNLLTGIAAAYMDSVPMVIITGNVPTALLGKDSFQEVDIAGASMPVVKHNWIVKNVDDLAPLIHEAFFVASSGRKGPVLIDIPKDITAISTDWKPREKTTPDQMPAGLSPPARRLRERSRRQTFSDADIERAADILAKARRPLLYAGGGVISAGADAELQSLAERLDAPVALSLMGIGAMPHGHRLCTGLIGMHGTVASNKAAQKADLLVAIGARFSDRVVCRADMFAKTARLLHFDIDPAEINKNIETNAWVLGDLKKTLGRLLEKLPAGVKGGWSNEIERWKRQAPKTHSAGSSKKGLHPRFVIEESAKLLGPKTIAVTDVGQHQIWAAQFFPAESPRSFLSSGGLGSMGFGLGAALGAKIANPGRPVVLFTGDGCFKMNCGELATLKACGIPVLILLFKNGVLGMVRQWQSFFYEGRHSETDLNPYPDFVKLSAAYGILGLRARSRSSFMKALKSAAGELAAGRSCLIEAGIDPDEKVLPMVPSGRPIDEQIL